MAQKGYLVVILLVLVAISVVSANTKWIFADTKFACDEMEGIYVTKMNDRSTARASCVAACNSQSCLSGECEKRGGYRTCVCNDCDPVIHRVRRTYQKLAV